MKERIRAIGRFMDVASEQLDDTYRDAMRIDRELARQLAAAKDDAKAAKHAIADLLDSFDFEGTD